jgi:hypothetical protein
MAVAAVAVLWKKVTPACCGLDPEKAKPDPLLFIVALPALPPINVVSPLNADVSCAALLLIVAVPAVELL